MPEREPYRIFRKFDRWYLVGYLVIFLGSLFPVSQGSTWTDSVRSIYVFDSLSLLMVLPFWILSFLVYAPITTIILLAREIALLSIVLDWPCLPAHWKLAPYGNLLGRLYGVVVFMLPVSFFYGNLQLAVGGWLISAGLIVLTGLRFYDSLFSPETSPLADTSPSK